MELLFSWVLWYTQDLSIDIAKVFIAEHNLVKVIFLRLYFFGVCVSSFTIITLYDQCDPNNNIQEFGEISCNIEEKWDWYGILMLRANSDSLYITFIKLESIRFLPQVRIYLIQFAYIPHNGLSIYRITNFETMKELLAQ